MFTIALKSQRVIVFLSIGTQLSSKRPESSQAAAWWPLEGRNRSHSREAERGTVQKAGSGREGPEDSAHRPV